MLSDLFKRLRPNEPIKVLVLRRLIIIISLTLLVATFALLCVGIYEELPSIKTVYTKVVGIPAPDIRFGWDKNFTITCEIYNIVDLQQNITIVNTTECRQKHILQPRYNDKFKAYTGIFYPLYVLNFTDTEGMTYIKIYLNTSGPTDNPIVMQAYDPEYSPYRLAINFNESDSFIHEVYFKNAYSLTNLNNIRSFYDWKFSRHIRKTMDKSFLSYIGFKPNYTERPYIESSNQFVPLSGSSDSIVVKLSTQYPTVIVETEQRSRTIGTIIGTMGGVWSAVLSFYVFLFGSDLISSWGLTQKLLKSKPKLKDPKLGDDDDDDEKDDEKDYFKKVDLKRITHNLEEHRKFYEENVITIPQKS